MGKKSVNNLYKPMLEHSNVEQKFHKAAKGKTERPDVAVILEPTNIQRHVKNVVEQLENTAPKGFCHETTSCLHYGSLEQQPV